LKFRLSILQVATGRRPLVGTCSTGEHGHRVESSANPVNDLDGINDLDNDVPPNEERNSRLAMNIGGRHTQLVQAHDSISAL